jgi:hypothetical protein
MLCYVLLCVCYVFGVLVYVMASFNVCRSIYVNGLLCFCETHFAEKEEDDEEDEEEGEGSWVVKDPYSIAGVSCIYVSIMCLLCVAFMFAYTVLCFCGLALSWQG